MSPETRDGEYAHSVGELLRSTRETKKLSLSDVHRDTKMSLPVLKALEQDDFTSFESEIYLRGFLKTYAKYLGLEADALVQRLDGQRGGGTPSSRGTTWDTEGIVKEERLRSPRILTRVILPLMLLVIVVLSILLALERRKVQEMQSNLRQVGRAAEVVDTQRA